MRQNALLRSDKGLGTPGTARKKKPKLRGSAGAASIGRAARIISWCGTACAAPACISSSTFTTPRGSTISIMIETALRRCVAAAGATLLHIHLHHFEPNGGVSGVAVLAESHISIHSWPEANYAALDVFMCGDANPEACIPVLREAFKPKRIAVSEHLRGQGA